MISEGCDVNAMDDRKWTSLHAASFDGHLEVAEHLIAKGIATIDAKNINGFTPLIVAAQEGHLKVDIINSINFPLSNNLIGNLAGRLDV